MTDYNDHENTEFIVTDTTMRKTRVDGETRYEKFILELGGHDKIESVSMRLEEYYSQEDKEEIDGIEFDTEEAEPEPAKAEDIPEIVKKIQREINENGKAALNATLTVATDEDNTNWFINPQNFEDIEVITEE